MKFDFERLFVINHETIHTGLLISDENISVKLS
jgi:hypothetical protein